MKKSMNYWLALCPAVAAASTAWAGLAIGALSLVIVLCSWLLYAVFGKIIPKHGRLVCGLVASAGLTAAACLLAEAYLPDIYAAVGSLLPLLAVQGVLLAAAFAGDAKSLCRPAVWLAYIAAMFSIGAVREFLGAGSILGFQVLGERFAPIAALSGVPGGFLALAMLGMIVNCLRPTRKEDES